ncbi:uncharacterized protein LOC111385885 isoform X4 [Olea europaea subsp. europaea]|uniref:Uncharacterized protein LOC111385885 isoform X4 n=1 Tax=Olea europaea subsp. europaea TaxID=158383 RepID=A0A8S0SX35_OLEEU|nr:uncharacterized protein LOC111385885 isoform X4 [Olea europaea subsp. europaea]
MWAAVTVSPNTKLSVPRSIYKNYFYKCKKNGTISVFDVFQCHCKRSLDLSVSCSSASSGALNDDNFQRENQELSKNQENKGLWQKWKENSAEMSSKLAKLGLAAVLAYGIFDGVTYTSFFVLAFLGYEKSTGKNPAANLQALLGVRIVYFVNFKEFRMFVLGFGI